jgi:DNA-binding protein YbaB
MRDLIKKLLREEVNPKVMAFFERKLKENLYEHDPFKFRVRSLGKDPLYQGIVSATVECVNLGEALRATTMDYYEEGVKLFYDGVELEELGATEVDEDVFWDDDHIKTMLVKMAAREAYRKVEESIEQDVKDWCERLSMDEHYIFVCYR